jgi:hypothetical protein
MPAPSIIEGRPMNETLPILRWGRTGRCRRARLSQPLMIAPAPIVSDDPTYQKPESGESRC